jgi:glycosyltransferase involved in cell wall biosynthesis
MHVTLSAVCPALNEAAHIEALLRFFCAAAPPDKELLIVDGGSSDDTRQIVRQWQQTHPGIRLLDNPERYVAFALNRAIPLCQGKYIVRLDAHTEYAGDYFEQIIAAFERTGADIVGGPTRTRSEGCIQAAVAQAICTPFGMGNSRVHQEDYEGYTDSVTFGAWRREIFDRTGLFDTRLVRNQDDEFHYRAKSLGLTLYQSPAIRLYYHPRASLVTLARQYFQYGLYKPLVLRKVPSEWKLRHLIPSGFFLYMAALPLLVFLSWLFLLPLAVYLAANVCSSVANRLPWRAKCASLAVYPIIHLSYGAGFLIGCARMAASASNR